VSVWGGEGFEMKITSSRASLRNIPWNIFNFIFKHDSLEYFL